MLAVARHAWRDPTARGAQVLAPGQRVGAGHQATAGAPRTRVCVIAPNGQQANHKHHGHADQQVLPAPAGEHLCFYQRHA